MICIDCQHHVHEMPGVDVAACLCACHAAAPELLAALNRIYRISKPFREDPEVSCIAEIALAAIAKAEGRA